MSAGAALALLAAVGVGAPAAAAPSATASPKPGTKVCSLPSDDRMTGVQGMVATSSGYDVVNDTDASGLSIYPLSVKNCSIGNPISDTAQTPTDASDLARTSDGSLWVSDAGDVDGNRTSIALWKFPKGQAPATKYDLTYPSGAEGTNSRALLMSPSGSPVIVSYNNPTTLYVPSGALNPNGTTQLKQAGSLTIKATGTGGGPLGAAGQQVVTGGAVSADGGKVVLRTYTDAYEWTVSGGDIVKSITSGTPRRTPLPNENDGEAISFSSDGAAYVTVNDTGAGAKVLRYTPVAAAASTASASAAASAKSGGLFSGPITQTDIITLLVLVGVVGIGLVVLGIVGIRRARRQGPASGADDEPPRGRSSRRRGGGPDRPDDADTVTLPRVRDGARSEPPPPAGRRYREEAVDNAETAEIQPVRDVPPPERPPTRARHGRPSPSQQYEREPEPPRRSRHEEPYRGPDPRDGYQAPSPREEYRAPDQREAYRPAPRRGPAPDRSGDRGRRYEPPPPPPPPAPPAAPNSEIDWLEDLRDDGPAPRHEPPEEPSGPMRRRYR